MKCPVCNDTNLMMTDRQGIEIDYCPQCRGVWLDRGELDKLIERSSIPATQPASKQRGPSQYSHDYGYHKKKKKGSFLGELFDF